MSSGDDANSIRTLALIQGGLGLAGGLLSGIGQAKQQNKDSAQSLAMFIANMQQRMNENLVQQRQFSDSLQQQQAEARLNATQFDPLAQQKSRAGFALKGEMLGNARPATLSFDPVSGVGRFNGGLSIPAGGFSPATLRYFSPESAANAEAEFARATNGLTSSGQVVPSSAAGQLASDLVNEVLRNLTRK